MPVRASYGPCTGFFNVFQILRHPCGTRKGTVRPPYGNVRELTQPELANIPHGRRIWPHGVRAGTVRLFTGFLRNLNPYGARNLIMHALKLYGKAKFVRRRTRPLWAPWVDVRCLFKTSREQPVRGTGVWCDWGITGLVFHFVAENRVKLGYPPTYLLFSFILQLVFKGWLLTLMAWNIRMN